MNSKNTRTVQCMHDVRQKTVIIRFWWCLWMTAEPMVNKGTMVSISTSLCYFQTLPSVPLAEEVCPLPLMPFVCWP